MTTRTYTCILFVLLAMCLDLVTQEGYADHGNVGVDAAGAAHFVWTDSMATHGSRPAG